MRISDWSSDVCSSDLLRNASLPCQTGSAFVLSGQPRNSQLPEPGGSQPPAGAGLLHSEPTCPEPALSFQPEPRKMEASHGRAHRHGRCALATRRCRAWPFDARARSEEHTSELQSLMRISYAV